MRMLALAFALLPAIAAGQTPPPAPDALAAARALLAATDIRGQMHTLLPSIAKATQAQMTQQFGGASMPDGLRAQLLDALEQFGGSFDQAFTPAVIDQMATIYARHYSATDLTRLTALVSDPVMVRFRSEMPALMGELMPVLLAAMKPQQDALQTKIRQIVANWTRDHPDDRAKLAKPDAR